MNVKTRSLLVPAIVGATLFTALAADARIRTGEDYLESCGGMDDVGERACIEPMLAEVAGLQANQSRAANPFARCPVSIVKPDELQEVLESMQTAFVKWLRQNRSQHDEPVGALVTVAFTEIDVCTLK